DVSIRAVAGLAVVGFEATDSGFFGSRARDNIGFGEHGPELPGEPVACRQVGEINGAAPSFPPGDRQGGSAGRGAHEKAASRALAVIGRSSELAWYLSVMRLGIDEGSHPKDHLEAVLLHEAHHLVKRVKAVEVLALECPTLCKLRHVEVKVVVGRLPGRVEDE